MGDIEVVTVFHRPRNRSQAEDLVAQVTEHEPDVKVHVWNNMKHNHGFAKGCNLGARDVTSPIIGFINPDAIVEGPFVKEVTTALSDPEVVICGNRYEKSPRELKIWKVKHFVCGACFFVDKEWFDSVGGFDERYVWSHEELDLIRQAETQGKGVRELRLPISHRSPVDDDRQDKDYKRKHFNHAAKQYVKKWGDRR